MEPNPNDKAMKYDPITDTWTYLADMPQALWHPTVQADPSTGLIYVIGGKRIDWTCSPTVYAYNPITDTYTTKSGTMPTPRHHAFNAIVDGKIYVIGGVGGASSSNFNMPQNEAYVIATDSWETGLTNIPNTGGDVDCSPVINGKIHCIGGYTGSAFLAHHRVYDPATDTWSSLAPMPVAKSSMGVEVYDGKIWVVGGSRNGDWRMGEVDIYDIEEDSWSVGTPLSDVKENMAIAVLNDGEDDKLYISHGFGENIHETIQKFHEEKGMHVATITIQSSQVAGDVSNYPIYVNLADMTPAFWSNVVDGGGDIRIYKDDDTTQLPREIVSCNKTAETGEMYVKYTGTLSGSVDTDIHIYVDGTSSEPASDSAYGSEAVWSNYVIVSHDGGRTDVTGRGYSITNNGVSDSDSAIIGVAGKFEKSNIDYLSYADSPDFDTLTTLSITAVVRKRSIGEQTIVAREAMNIGLDPYNIWDFKTDSANKLRGWVAIGGSRKIFNASGFALAENTWYHVGMIANGSTVKGYINAVERASTPASGSIDVNNKYVTIGRGGNDTYTWDGDNDELRIRAGSIGTDFLTTEKNNLMNVSSFYTVATVLDPKTAVQTLDALIMELLSSSHTLNALVGALATGSHTLDAFVNARGQLSHALDGLVYELNTGYATGNVLVDGLVVVKEQVSHSTDAFVVLSQNIAHNADALVNVPATTSHTTDAWVRVSAGMETHTIDTYVNSVITYMEDTKYTDKTSVEEYLIKNIDVSYNSQVDMWIVAMSRYIDRFCNRTIFRETEETFKYDGDGSEILHIGDCIDPTVKIGDQDIEVVTYPSNKPYASRIVRKDGARWPKGLQNVEVTGVQAMNLYLPDDIKYACTILVAGIVRDQLFGEKSGTSEKIDGYSITYNSERDKSDIATAMKVLSGYKRIAL